MEYSSINSYILPLTNIIIGIICTGIIARCIFIIVNMEPEDQNDVGKKLRRKAKAAIIALCIVGLLNVIAAFYRE